jgi:hypothetical protein
MEPGEAVGWQTGYLVATVLDVIKNGMNLAILDTSAEAHMPDTLAMPYRAMIRNSGVALEKEFTYRLGGNTCLAGDIIGDLNSRRGIIQGMSDNNNAKIVDAMVPLSEMFGYATDIRSKSQGRATYSMEFNKYEEVPANIAKAIIAERGK